VAARRATILSLVASAVISHAAAARADDAPDSGSTKQEQHTDESSLTRQAQNPIANLVSIPFQLNLNGGMGTYDRTQMLLNVQPVIETRPARGAPIDIRGAEASLARVIKTAARHHMRGFRFPCASL
jgi:hypothetical protein